ncbi:MAG: 50S ribosomal protein L18 [Ignavibacteriales bacterium]|nr:50S ribosomal protein L18 [Ignavibacteriales bacterium]
MILKNTPERRIRRKARIRTKILGTSARPRLAVYRSLKHVYAQIIDDAKGLTIVSASSLSKDVREQAKDAKSSLEVCRLVGIVAARKALENNIKEVVFDRGGYLYHGRVKAVADGAREAGLKF